MKKSLLLLLLLFFTLPTFAKKTILIVGDSLSAGYNITLEKSWAMLLKQRLQDQHYDYDVINVSISGNTTSNGLAQLPKAIEQHTPHIVIIEVGGNDGLRGLQLEIIKNNLQTMITLSKKNNAKVLLLGVRLPPNYGPAYTQQFQAIFSQLAKKNNISVVPLFLNSIDENNDLMNTDRIHPNEKAQSIMLDNVWPTLKPML